MGAYWNSSPFDASVHCCKKNIKSFGVYFLSRWNISVFTQGLGYEIWFTRLRTTMATGTMVGFSEIARTTKQTVRRREEEDEEEGEVYGIVQPPRDIEEDVCLRLESS